VPEEQDATLRRRLEQAYAFVLQAPATDLQPRRVPAALNLRSGTDVFVALLSADGRPLISTGEVDGAAPSLPSSILNRADAYVLAGQSLQHNRTQIGGLVFLLIVASVISMIVAAAAIWLVVGRALRPLKTVALAADEIARTRDLSRRLPPVRTRDEVRLLTDSFNGMLARLEEGLEAQRRFVADASHELRTPLTTIRTNAAYLQRPDVPSEERDAALHDIADESERMSRLVHDLLTLARADAGLRLELSSVELTTVARAIARRAGTLHPQRQIEVAGDESVPVRGNEDALTQLLWILVDNALRHTPPSSRVRIWTARAGSSAQLRVMDDGGGIPPEALARIFDRFYQADSARGGDGTGLGLAIARWIAAEHHGALSAYNNEWGGATFLFELPLAADLSSNS
jgi:signal transduction histidine kinase